MSTLTTTIPSILIFSKSSVDLPSEYQKKVLCFEAKSLDQVFQILFKNPIDILLTSDGTLPIALENFLKKSKLSPMIADITAPFSQTFKQLENQKLTQKNVSMNEQFELLIQYGEWNLNERLNDNESVLLVCPPGAEAEAAALAIHLRSIQQADAFEIYRFENKSETQIEKDLWGYFWQEENPYINRGFLNQKGTLLLGDANRMPTSIQQKLSVSLKYIQKRIIAASPIPLLSLSQNNLFSKELATYLSKQVITLAALEDRLFDLPAIADQVLVRINKKYHLQIAPLTTENIQVLTGLRFENGYKELEAILTLAALKRQKGSLTPEDFKII